LFVVTGEDFIGVFILNVVFYNSSPVVHEVGVIKLILILI
jgi:hypothetical protein